MKMPKTSAELFKQAFQHYQDQKFEEAFILLTDSIREFSDWSWKIQFWRICMASKLNNVQLALSIFNEAIQDVYWYSETQLRDDKDLEILQGLSEFEQLVEICKEKQQAARLNAVSKKRIIELIDTEENVSMPLLMALHGNERNTDICYDYWKPAIPENWLLVLPQSSQNSGPGVYSWDDWRIGETEIEKHYEEIQSEYPIDKNQRLIGGFSMGGRLAIRLALSQKIEVKGFIVVCPFLPHNDSWDWGEIAKRNRSKQVRGYMIVGEEDKASYEGSHNLISTLKENKIPCEIESCPKMGHAYPKYFSHSLKQGIKFCLSN